MTVYIYYARSCYYILLHICLNNCNVYVNCTSIEVPCILDPVLIPYVLLLNISQPHLTMTIDTISFNDVPIIWCICSPCYMIE